MDLIDTHQHLILRDKIGYAWTAGVPALAMGDFTHANYAGLVAGRGVIGSVFMETGVDDESYQTEARVMAGLIGQGGMLGQVASCRPETDAGFADWLAESDGLSVVGFRRILHEIDDAVSQTATFRRNLRRIGAKGLPFDLCFLARQLPIAADLARACDAQILVLDHCGVPDIAAGAFDEWHSGIKALAAFPHVYCKFSGISRYCTQGTASVAVMQPYADAIVAAFGPARMVWGGDWPVVNLGMGLPGWIDASRTMLAGLSADEQAQIGHLNARKVYGLGKQSI